MGNIPEHVEVFLVAMMIVSKEGPGELLGVNLRSQTSPSKVMILVDSLDDCIAKGSKRAPTYQFEIPGMARNVIFLLDGLDCIDEGTKRVPRCEFEIPGIAQKALILLDSIDHCMKEGQGILPGVNLRSQTPPKK